MANFVGRPQPYHRSSSDEFELSDSKLSLAPHRLAGLTFSNNSIILEIWNSLKH